MAEHSKLEEKIDNAFTRQYLPQWLFVCAAALVLISACVWWTKVYESPYNVYWGMLESSLETTGVTKHITEQANGTKLDQYISLNFGTSNLAYAKTSLQSAVGVVNTETIGTPQNDYVRYTTIDVTGKNAKKLDTSKVLNKWSKTAALNTGSANAAVPFFAQVMLGFEGGNLVPVANLPSASRAQLLQRLHRDVIFQTSFSNVKRQKVAGRAVYTYEVSVQPVAYAAFQKAFAQAIGMKTLDDVDPNAYQNQTAIKVELSVDARSHQLVSVNYPASKHVETYSSYGVPTEVALPGKTISSSQLQGLLSAL